MEKPHVFAPEGKHARLFQLSLFETNEYAAPPTTAVMLGLRQSQLRLVGPELVYVAPYSTASDMTRYILGTR